MVTGLFPGPLMSELCDLCRGNALKFLYQPERSTRGISVHLCTHCGLVQSLPRINHQERAPAAVSGGADWGNVRYGKGFRTKIALDALRRHFNFNDEFSLLDVGSNRGSFAALFSTPRQMRISLLSSPTSASPRPAPGLRARI